MKIIEASYQKWIKMFEAWLLKGCARGLLQHILVARMIVDILFIREDLERLPWRLHPLYQMGSVGEYAMLMMIPPMEVGRRQPIHKISRL